MKYLKKIFESKKVKPKKLSKLLEKSITYELYYETDGKYSQLDTNEPEDLYDCIEYYDVRKQSFKNLIIVKTETSRELLSEDDIDFHRSVHKYNL